MKSRTEWLVIGLISAGVTLLTLVPYLAAEHWVPDDRVFSGFLINPVDGYSYLAKMRQGMTGGWLFQLPYAALPSGGAAIFLYYLALGHLTGLLGLPPLVMYQAARLVAGFLMFLSAYALLKAALPDQRQRFVAFGLILVGSGLGWLGTPAGLEGTDLLVPESIPFVTVFTNPHFPLALALEALGARLIIGSGRSAVRAGASLAVGLGLGIVWPFAAVPLIIAGAVWKVWELRRARPERSAALSWLVHADVLPTLALALGAAPWLGYDYWVVSSRPAFAAWNAQNLTPSPPVWAFALGFGLVLVWAILAVWRSGALGDARGRYLASWAAVNGLLLYVPFNLQRRFSLGLFIPLAALAAIGLVRTLRLPDRRGWLALTLVMLLSLPSNALVVAAGLSTAAGGSPLVTESTGESQGYSWIRRYVPAGSVVLASPETGIRLPAYASVRVVAGHPFETPDVQARTRNLRALFEGTLSAESAKDLLADWKVAFVFYGPRERTLGPPPTWLSGFSLAYQAGDVTIYRASGE